MDKKSRPSPLDELHDRPLKIMMFEKAFFRNKLLLGKRPENQRELPKKGELLSHNELATVFLGITLSCYRVYVTTTE